MNETQTIEISSLGDYLTHLESKKSLIYKTAYRGEANQDWKLLPSLFRMPFVPSENCSWRNYEEIILDFFRSYGTPYFPYDLENQVDLMAIAQHHGLPTRLLDWTKNPLVALFFAVENLNLDFDSTVYEINLSLHAFKPNCGWESPATPELIMIYPKYVTKRLSQQSGCFTVHPFPNSNESVKDVEELVKHSGRHYSFKKFLIRKCNRKAIKVELDTLGINYFSLFPDLDGLSKQMKWELLEYGLVQSPF